MANPYETRRYLDEYLLFHYGKARDLCPFSFVPQDLLRFHERIREECLLPIPHQHAQEGRARCPQRAAEHSNAGSSAMATLLTERKGLRAPPDSIRALDVGCAVGRFSFELSRVADEVLGIDNSQSFINAARGIARRPRVRIRIQESGAKSSSREVTLPRGVRAGKVRFDVGDALDLRPFAPAGPYQIVAAINLLCRLPSPRKFLRQLPRLVAPGGQVILASPFSWLEQYTTRSNWLSPEALETNLRSRFRLARRRDLPFVIREHRRKYQLVISHVLTFVRV